MDASTTETIETAFKNIATIKGAGNSVQATLSWLIGNQDNWLLFFDNADDPQLNLSQFFPKCNHGNIIITSQNHALRQHGEHFEVSAVEESDPVTLLLKSSLSETTPTNELLATDIVKVSREYIHQNNFLTL